MDYEQKYKDALERAKKIHCFSSDISEIKRMEELFPELKESEDERIRKRIIHALHGDVLDMEETNKAIAWLEKQREQEYHCTGVGEPKEPTGALKQLLDEIKSWSKEDERLRKTTISFLKDFADKGYENAVECIDWLKQLKYRIGD